MHLFHRWKIVRDTGITVYSQCKMCGKRRVTQYGGFQPIDRHWVKTGEWQRFDNPPKGTPRIVTRPED